MKQVRGYHFLVMALLAFVGITIKIFYAAVLEPAIYGAQMSEWTTSQTILHWIITCITWGIVAAVLIKISENKLAFDLFSKTPPMKAWQWVAIIAGILLMTIRSYLAWGGVKVQMEFQSKGLLLFLFQYLYYLFETVLFTLIIVFGQKACELWFRKESFPYGGILVAVTWGLVHILSQGSLFSGLYSAFAGFIFGVTYLLVNKDIKKTLAVLYIMFVF